MSIKKMCAVIMSVVLIFSLTVISPISAHAETDYNIEIIKGRTYTSGDDIANLMIIRQSDKYILAIDFESDANWKTAYAFMQTLSTIRGDYVYVPSHALYAKTKDTDVWLVYKDFPKESLMGNANGKSISIKEWVTNRIYEMDDAEGAVFITWLDECLADFSEIATKNPTEVDISEDFSYGDGKTMLEADEEGQKEQSKTIGEKANTVEDNYKKLFDNAALEPLSTKK